jgi:hypothetical protein
VRKRVESGLADLLGAHHGGDCSGSGEGIRFWDRSNLKGQKTVAVPARTGSLHARTHTGGMFQLFLMAIGIREMKGTVKSHVPHRRDFLNSAWFPYKRALMDKMRR